MLRLENICKTFPFANEAIFKNLSLELNKGEFTILIGGNGSGKSTLVKIIQGEHKADSGDVFLNSQKLTQDSLAQRASHISIVSQDLHTGTVRELTLLENLVLSLARGKSASFQSVSLKKEICEEHVKKLGIGLERFLHTPMMNLSGGQKQILAFVMATALKPNLLLLDEPTSALDPKTSQQLMALVDKTVREEKLTTLMVTHSLSDALRYGDRLIMLREGKIIFDVHGSRKASLTLQELLDLYHHYEDSSLL